MNNLEEKLDLIENDVLENEQEEITPIASSRLERLKIDTSFIPIMHNEENIIEVSGLKQYFPIRKGFLKRLYSYIKSVDNVSFNIRRGTTLGLVGESGCGKSTLGRSLLYLYKRTAGQILFDGENLDGLNEKQFSKYRTKMQMIFQDPFSSLNPRFPVSEIITEAVRIHKIVKKEELNDYIEKVMTDCGLYEYQKNRYPHEFSGGQRQRICIARSLALQPEFIVCDEPVSALDVSIQAQIINLLKDLQQKNNLTYLFISHDLSVVEHISDEIAVMYLGEIVEKGDRKDIFKYPLHPYTKALFSAIPIPDPDRKTNRIILNGNIPSPSNPPKGCSFHTRCKYCMDICKKENPEEIVFDNQHSVCCFLYKKDGKENNP